MLGMGGFAVGVARTGAAMVGSGPAGAHLPDTGFLAVYHRHVAGLAIFDELLLSLIELLRHEAHEGVVWGVSYSPAAEGKKELSNVQAAAQNSLLSMWGQHPGAVCPGL